MIRFADVTIDVAARELRRAGTLIDVQPQVLDVLLHLIEHRSRVVAKEELLDQVWKHRFVTESALTSRIKSARQAIGDSGRDQRLIRTMHGRGYRFVGSLDPGSSDGSHPSDGSDPSVSAEAGTVRRVRLPIQPTPFVGREFELGVVSQIVADPSTRLVTILGPGGMGKTRLAIAAAEQSEAGFGDGVVFVPLAPVGAAERVVDAVADAVGLGLDARVDPLLQLQTSLRARQMLLVLDNVEHLVRFDVVVDAVASLLEAAPGVRILATSRERLGLRAERVVELGGMGWSSSGGDLEGGGAVELFLRSARSAKADLRLDDGELDLVRHICRLVGGMPLAIELAAGWSDVLSIDGIAAEVERGLEFLETDLRDVPERHRSVRAVCDSSWERLSPDERDVFMKLSVFRGGFTRAAAAAVAGAELPTLRRLVATSMVMLGGTDRYAVHELLRQYGEQALTDAGNASDVRRLHSDHYLGRLVERAAALRGGRQLDAVDEIAVDLDNLRAAWTAAVIDRRVDVIEAAVESLWLFFDARGSSGAMVPMIDEALRRATAATGDERGSGSGASPHGPMLRAVRGIASAERGDLDEGRRMLESAAEELDRDADRSDDREVRARAGLVHLWLGWVDFLLARNDDARVHGELALACFESVGDRWGAARCQYLLGNNDTALGRLASAERMLLECRATAEAIGDVRGASLARRNLGILAGWFGRYGDARRLIDDVVATCTSTGDRLGLAYALRELGKIETSEGRAEEAVAALRRSIAITDDLENRWESAVTEDDLGNALAELGDLEGAQCSLERCLHAATAHGNRYYVARSTGDLGALAARRGDLAEAKRLLEAAQAMWEQIGHEPYLTSTMTTLARVAAAKPGRRRRAVDLYAVSMSRAIEAGLVPFVLDIVVGAAEIGHPEHPAARASNLRCVVEHPAATAAARGRAADMLDALGDGVAGPAEESTGAWQPVAQSLLAALTAVAERAGP